MTIPAIHSGLAAGRWHALSLCEQLGNVGSEVSRALTAWETGNVARMQSAFERGLELLDLTIADPKNRSRLKELCRVRDVVRDFFAGDNEYQSTGASLNRYFMPFALVARR